MKSSKAVLIFLMLLTLYSCGDGVCITDQCLDEFHRGGGQSSFNFTGYNKNSVILGIGQTNVNLTPTISGSYDSFSVSPALPAGLTLNSSTGVISGSPSGVQATTDYTVTASGPSKDVTVTIKIQVIDAYIVTTTAWTNDLTPGDGACADNSTGACSLLAAVNENNNGASIKDILLSAGTYTFSAALNLTQSFNFIGESKNSVTFDGNSSTQLLTINAGTTHTFRNINFSNASHPNGSGSVISANGEANINITINDFTISNNSAGTGALFVGMNTTFTLRRGRFTANSGGAIQVLNGGNLIVEDTAFTSNSSAGEGGAIYAQGGTIDITRSLFSNNTAPASYQGGAIYNQAYMTITNSTFHVNTADLGGAISSNGTESYLTFTHNTVAENNARNSNAGGGIYITNSASVTNSNNLFQNNRSNGVTNSCFITDGTDSTVNSNGGNIIDDASTDCWFEGANTNDSSSTTVALGTLANNGGYTYTRSIASDSLAVNNGVNGSCTGQDQRGASRHILDLNCDSGAYEVSTTSTVTFPAE